MTSYSLAWFGRFRRVPRSNSEMRPGTLRAGTERQPHDGGAPGAREMGHEPRIRGSRGWSSRSWIGSKWNRGPVIGRRALRLRPRQGSRRGWAEWPLGCGLPHHASPDSGAESRGQGRLVAHATRRGSHDAVRDGALHPASARHAFGSVRADRGAPGGFPSRARLRSTTASIISAARSIWHRNPRRSRSMSRPTTAISFS